MGKPYSDDLRKRVVAAVETGGVSLNWGGKQIGGSGRTGVGGGGGGRETGGGGAGKMWGDRAEASFGENRPPR